MDETTNKVVTTENLGTFKSEMEKVVDEKIAEAGTANLTYATEEDILALFAEPAVEETNTDETV